MKHRAIRYGPALLALLAALLGLQVTGVQIPGRVEPETWNLQPATFASPLAAANSDDCARLVSLSEVAASLVGSLALVEAEARPEAALGVSEGLRLLAEQEANGTELDPVLTDLAGALADYAAGDAAALARIQAASARNAELRERYTSCAIGDAQLVLRDSQ